MAYIGITVNSMKLAYIRSTAGVELTNFWEHKIKARWDNTPGGD